MELKHRFKRTISLIKKYKYAVMIIAVGLFLMLLPAKKENTPNTQNVIASDHEQSKPLEDQLAQILCQIKGVGKVKVMLSVAQGEQIVYQTNDSSNSDSDSTREDTDTVIITDSDRNQKGLIHQINPPVYMGAIIICQGADDPTVKLSIAEAVSKITGLKMNRISVLKMK